MGRHGVGVAVVSLLGRRSGIAGNDTGSVITPVRHGQRHLDVTERGGEKFGQFEINGRPLDVAENVAPCFVGPHASGVGVVTASADRHRDAVKDGHVLLVVVESFQPIGQFVLGQVDFKGFFFLVLFQLLGGKGG